MPGKFNLEDYETVKQRKARFKGDYPDSRIIVVNKSDSPQEYAFFEATIYANKEDQAAGLPLSTGNALELRDWELKQGRKGPYESVNYTSWTENCEESAVGRALDNAGYASSPSQAEMAKVQRAQEAEKQKKDAQDAQEEDGVAAEAREYIENMLRDAVKENLIPENGSSGAEAVREKMKSKRDARSLKAYANSLSKRFKEMRDERSTSPEPEKAEIF